MEVEIKPIKNELQKISLDFRTVANRLIRTRQEDGISNLKRFLKHIDSDSIINEFIQEHNYHKFDNIQSIISEYRHLNHPIPNESESEEISFIYQVLKYALKEYDFSDGYLHFAMAFVGHSGEIQQILDKFNSTIILPFYYYIENHLRKLQIDMNDDENSKYSIHVGGDNYGNNIGAKMTETNNFDQSNSSIGIGVSQGEVKAEKIAGTINEAQQQTLAEAAAEIQQLLEQLDKTYDTSTYSGKGQVADEIIKNIENNPTLTARILSALKTGGVKAFEQFLSHPAASFIIGVLEDWQKTKGS